MDDRPGEAAARDLPGLSSDTVTALWEILRVPEDDGPLGTHYFKSGSLGSDPITRIRSGFWDGPEGVRRASASWPRSAVKLMDFGIVRIQPTSFDETVTVQGPNPFPRPSSSACRTGRVTRPPGHA